MIEVFSGRWFTLYYLTLGILSGISGLYLLFRTNHFDDYLKLYIDSEYPPPAIRVALKYFLLFTIPTLILSFFPFSWVELLFSIWSLLVVYIIGLQLVRWKQLRNLLKYPSARLKYYIRYAGAIMLAVSVVMFLLSYLVIIRN